MAETGEAALTEVAGAQREVLPDFDMRQGVVAFDYDASGSVVRNETEDFLWTQWRDLRRLWADEESEAMLVIADAAVARRSYTNPFEESVHTSAREHARLLGSALEVLGEVSMQEQVRSMDERIRSLQANHQSDAIAELDHFVRTHECRHRFWVGVMEGDEKVDAVFRFRMAKLVGFHAEQDDQGNLRAAAIAEAPDGSQGLVRESVSLYFGGPEEG